MLFRAGHCTLVSVMGLSDKISSIAFVVTNGSSSCPQPRVVFGKKRGTRDKALWRVEMTGKATFMRPTTFFFPSAWNVAYLCGAVETLEEDVYGGM